MTLEKIKFFGFTDKLETEKNNLSVEQIDLLSGLLDQFRLTNELLKTAKALDDKTDQMLCELSEIESRR